jgi:hypothetical protein
VSSTTQTGPARAGNIAFDCEPIRYLLRTVLIFLREVFGSAPNSQYFYSAEDPDASRIIITSDLPISADVIGDRPHIVAFFGGIQMQGVGLDQLKEQNMLTGARKHQDTFTGNLTISVLSRNAEEATYIAFQIMIWTWLLRRVLLGAGFTDIGQRMHMTAPTAPGQMVTNDLDGEIIAVSVIAPFHFVWEAAISELGNHLLEKIEVTIQTTLPGELPGVVKQHGLPLGMIGSATSKIDGTQPTREFDKMASVMADIRDRRPYQVVGTMDDPPVPPQPIEMNLTIEGDGE